MSDRLLQIISKSDIALQDAEDSTIDRVNTALESAYRTLEKQLLEAYSKHSGNLDLLPKQRSLVILDEVSSVLSLINTRNAEQIQSNLESLLRAADDSGATLADAMTRAIANERLQDFATVPLEAVRMQAENGMGRLYRYDQDFRSKASAIVEIGLVLGQGPQRIARSLRQELGTTKANLERIARTESISAHNQAIAANLKRNGYELVQIFATVDDRVCATCAARNQLIYKLEEIAVPFHPYCRCVIVPFDRRWVEAGLVDEEWSRKFREEAIAQVEAQGKKLNEGLSPFEKMNGMKKPPVALPGKEEKKGDRLNG
jgi:SPP1 gp7 family putative phage head morphogenesis protein